MTELGLALYEAALKRRRSRLTSLDGQRGVWSPPEPLFLLPALRP